MEQTKASKLDKLNIKSLDDLTEDYIDAIYKVYLSQKKEKERVKPSKNIDKSTDQYRVALKFVNRILENLDKDIVTDLTGFKDIDRLDIIKQENHPILEDMEKELFTHFSKIKCGFYNKSDNIVLNVLRGMCRQMGVKLSKARKERWHKIGDKSYKLGHILYSINH